MSRPFHSEFHREAASKYTAYRTGKPGAPLREPGMPGAAKYVFLLPAIPNELWTVTCPLGSGWFTLKKLPRCTPFERKKLMSSTESLEGWNSRPRLVWIPYGA